LQFARTQLGHSARISGEKNKWLRERYDAVDFTKPVEQQNLGSKAIVYRWEVPGGRKGGGFVTTNPAATPSQLGINPNGQVTETSPVVPKVLRAYRVREGVVVPALRSTASGITDKFSVPSAPFQTEGGADQFMIDGNQFDNYFEPM
jgi:hypothetical protein